MWKSAMSQRTAWRGGLWFCPLRLTDHRMMNHTPAQSKSAHTHTHTQTHRRVKHSAAECILPRINDPFPCWARLHQHHRG